MAALGGLLLGATTAPAQQTNRFIISGYVRDGATGENLPGVAVVHPASRQGTSTNTFGFYSLSPPPRSIRISTTCFGSGSFT